MAALERIDSIAVWVRDPAKAEEFYTGALGLKVLERSPDVGWLTVVPPAGGTALALLVPDPGSADYEETKAQVGGHTGIAFTTGNLRAALERLREQRVTLLAANLDPAAVGGLSATLEDQDGNALLLFQPEAKAKGSGELERVAFVNVVIRGLHAGRAFYQTSLGLAPGEALTEMSWQEFRLPGGSASVGLLEPVEETYREPADFAEDMRHLGEPTGITFLTRDLDAALAELRSRGVFFGRSPEDLPQGGRAAQFEDPDGNRFLLLERGASWKHWAAPAKRAPARRGSAKPAARKPNAKAKPAKAKPKASKAKRPARGRAATKRPAPRRKGKGGGKGR